MLWYKDKRHINQGERLMKKTRPFPYFAEKMERGGKISFEEIRDALILEAISINDHFQKKIVFSLVTFQEHVGYLSSLTIMLRVVKGESTEAWNLAKEIPLIPSVGYDINILRKVVADLLNVSTPSVRD